MASLKRLLLGSPIRTARLAHERLTKKTALAVFSSDALSSTAYATEEILLVLAASYVLIRDPSVFSRVIPVSIGIATLLIIVAISYRQTIHAYPSGGGSYIVAKDNLGTMPGLIAAASLLVDYILTVSVSIAAGVAAITSTFVGTKWAWLDEHRVGFCLFFIAFIALANLRGVRESGALFAGPTYAFIVSFLFMIGYGLIKYFLSPHIAPANDLDLKVAEGYHPQALTWFLFLGAFSNGCAALTGIEAISNGIPAFKQPESDNAAKTLTVMAGLLATMFIGTSVMAYLYHIHPHEHETVISQFGRIIFTGYMSWFYYLVQITTAAILVLAANTSFADFPRLSSLLARDRFLPRQFANRGDRLVFSNGIILLAVFSGILVWAFGGETSRLIPLYAVGVFLSFTLSQSGMVVHWWKEGQALKRMRAEALAAKETNEGAANTTGTGGLNLLKTSPPTLAEVERLERNSHWRKSIVINGVGALATCVVLMVFIATKFIHGAWVVVALIPLLVLMFLKIHRHYVDVARQLSTEGLATLKPIDHEVIVPISGIHRGVIQALQYAKSIAPHHVTAVYVNLDDEQTMRLREKWDQWGSGVNLVIVASPYRSLARPLFNYVDRVRRGLPNALITVVLPEFVPAKWWQNLLHNQNTLFLKGALLFKKGVVVTNVPYHLEH